MKKRVAFTLSEVLIVLVIIGVLTAILMPVAFQSSPDEKLMKFKKAHSTLMTVIRELVNSDKYYDNGDLGLYNGGKLVKSPSYFCETIADVLSVKSAECQNSKDAHSSFTVSFVNVIDGKWGNTEIDASVHFDDDCRDYNEAGLLASIKTPDNVIYYDCAPNTTFGAVLSDSDCLADIDNLKCEADNRMFTATRNNFLLNYKVFCIDIDGINQGEDPFGYGIRVDGKILPGKRALDWINKSLKKE